MAEQERLCGDTHLHVALAKLNLPPDVTYADAKRRYHALVKKLHPDKSNDDGTRAAFDRIRGAYIVVEEELRRRESLGASSRIDSHDGPAAARTTWRVTLLLAVIFAGLIWFTAEAARDLSRPHHHHHRHGNATESAARAHHAHAHAHAGAAAPGAPRVAFLEQSAGGLVKH